jgi:transposase
MGFIRGECRNQGRLFPVVLDDLISADHMCRVIDAFVDTLEMDALGFERAEPADTGRPGYDPRDLLKLYLYGYLNQTRSSRRLESECRRNLELMWLLGRLYPDHKSIAEFRRMHREAISATGAKLVQFARSVGLIRGEWIAVDGSKFLAASSTHSVYEREKMRRYLDGMEAADLEQEEMIDSSAVAAALVKIRNHPELFAEAAEESGLVNSGRETIKGNEQVCDQLSHLLPFGNRFWVPARDQNCKVRHSSIPVFSSW